MSSSEVLLEAPKVRWNIRKTNRLIDRENNPILEGVVYSAYGFAASRFERYVGSDLPNIFLVKEAGQRQAVQYPSDEYLYYLTFVAADGSEHTVADESKAGYAFSFAGSLGKCSDLDVGKIVESFRDIASRLESWTGKV